MISKTWILLLEIRRASHGMLNIFHLWFLQFSAVLKVVCLLSTCFLTPGCCSHICCCDVTPQTCAYSFPIFRFGDSLSLNIAVGVAS